MNQFKKATITETIKQFGSYVPAQDIPVEYLKESYYLVITTNEWEESEIHLVLEREETDKEFNERLELFNKSSKNQQEKEYKQYLTLKAKFEGNGSN